MLDLSARGRGLPPATCRLRAAADAPRGAPHERDRRDIRPCPRRRTAIGPSARSRGSRSCGCSCILVAARRARGRLDRLRDDDGGRPRPAEPRRPRRSSRRARNSMLFDVRGQPLGILTSDREPDPRPATSDISPIMRERGHLDRGQALLRATAASTSAASRARSSRTSSAAAPRQGGSTITQQFVKNALEAQGNRTVFQKLREAALAYHLDAQVVQGEDPHRVPQHDLLRQRRLRRSSRRRAPTSAGPNHVGCGDAPPAVRAAS